MRPASPSVPITPTLGSNRLFAKVKRQRPSGVFPTTVAIQASKSLDLKSIALILLARFVYELASRSQ